LAAQNHAEYLLQTDNTRQSKNPEMRTLHLRIVFYGGKYLSTAENMTQSYLFTAGG